MPTEEQKRPILTLPKKKPADERAEFLALQQTIHEQRPRDGALRPDQIPAPRPQRPR